MDIRKEKKRKFYKKIFICLIAFLCWIPLIFVYINLPVAKVNTPVLLGVTFSSRYAGDIGLDWKQAYVAMLDDLGVRDVRVPVYWDLVETERGIYDFSDVDWQMDEAAKRDARVILVIGQKVPRWPECFIPGWAKDDNVRKEALINFEGEVVKRYKDHPALQRWQVENEPFLNFGICPKLDMELLDREIALVHKVDDSHPIVITDSGELSVWVRAASRADVFGTTMYRTVYSAKYGYLEYPIGPNFFKLKKKLVDIFANQEKVIVIELQGEPWINGWTVDATLERQFESMTAEKLRDNVDFAKKTDISEIYIWGVEWWFWLMSEKNHPELWDEAKSLFKENTIRI
jgi:hypothetical protein